MSRFGGEYKFPDELGEEKNEQEVNITIEGDDEVEVKIVDDTPQEDQFATPPLDENTQQELEKADESEEYSKNVKVKFKQYKKAWHDERRAKEAAFREQQEALTVAERILDENKRLKSILHSGEKELNTFAKACRRLVLSKEWHPRVTLTHQAIVDSIRLSLCNLRKMFITLFHKLNRALAEQQPTNFDIIFKSTIGVD